MKMQDLANNYIAYKETLEGQCNIPLKYLLKQFAREMGADTAVGNVTKEMVLSFLIGKKGIITNSWFSKRAELKGLFNYAIFRGYINEIPLPNFSPQKPPKYVPYIYSNEELKSLFDTALTYQKAPSLVDPFMIRTILILTYTMGAKKERSSLYQA